MRRKDRPPALALLLLRKWGSVSYRESLAGDLIEGYARGKDRLWVWREVLHALGAAALRRPSFAPCLSMIKGAILAAGLVMLGAATFSWAASLTEDNPSAVRAEP